MEADVYVSTVFIVGIEVNIQVIVAEVDGVVEDVPADFGTEVVVARCPAV
jgi:hypothetical protein